MSETGGVAQSTNTVDGQRLLLAVKYRRRPYLPRRALHVLLAQRLGNIIGSDIQRVHAVGPQPDTHAVVARAEYLHFPDARQTRQRLAHLCAGVVADKQRRQRAERRVKTDAHQQVRRPLAHLNAVLLHVGRQLRHRLRHAVLHVDRG